MLDGFIIVNICCCRMSVYSSKAEAKPKVVSQPFNLFAGRAHSRGLEVAAGALDVDVNTSSQLSKTR